jgi:drug/metabolite transporter (DMT)-like permease
MVAFILALITAMMWGIQAIFLRVAMREMVSYYVVLVSLTIHFILLMAVIGMKEGMMDLGSVTWSCFIYLGISGILNSFLGRSFYYRSFQHIGATHATAISSSYPMISVGFAIFILGEELKIRQYVGIALTLLGLYCLIWKSRS